MRQELHKTFTKILRSFSFVDHNLDDEEIIHRRKEVILYSIILVISIILIFDV